MTVLVLGWTRVWPSRQSKDSEDLNGGTGYKSRGLGQISQEAERSSTRIEDLLGRPLNDVEAKHAPRGEIYYEGPMEIPFLCPRVSIIGSRAASKKGLLEAGRIAKVLVENGVIVAGGLAKGIDTAGHKAAIEYGGRTVAVIGTPLDRAYPKENLDLQNEIKRNHLVVSQYPVGRPTAPKDFVLRNRTMALISDATVIVEAWDSSGSLHQGWETLRMGRPLFICKTVTENESLAWPKKMSDYGAMTLDEPVDILENIPSNVKMPELLQ